MKINVKKGRTAALVAMVLATIVLAAGALALERVTLIHWSKPAAACLAAALPLGVFLRRAISALTGLANKLLCSAIGVTAMFAALSGGFYIANYFGADDASRQKITARVIRKYSEERHRTRRVGRNRYIQGDKYMVYNLVMSLPGGKEMTRSVSTGEYIKTREGRTVDMYLVNGLFGIQVIKNSDALSKTTN